MLFKDVASKAVHRIDEGKPIPRAFLRATLVATLDLISKTLEEPHPQEVMNAVAKLSADSYTRDTQLLSSINGIKKGNIMGAPKNASGVTYASVTAGGARAAGIDLSKGFRTPRQDNKDRTVIVKVPDDNAAKENKQMDPKSLKAKVNKALKDISITQQEIGAARALPISGDIQIITTTKEEAAKLKQDTTWVKQLHTKAYVAKPTFGVICKGVWVPDLPQEKEKLEEQIQRENQSLEIKPVWAGYLHRLKGHEMRAPIVLEFGTAQEANTLVQKGLFIGSCWQKCYVFNKKCRTMQCHKCWIFGHLESKCTNTQKCGNCGDQHKTEDCKATKTKCARCTGPHQAKSHECALVCKERQRVEREKLATPMYHPDHQQTRDPNEHTSQTRSGTPRERPQSPVTTGTDQVERMEVEMATAVQVPAVTSDFTGDFTFVTPKRKTNKTRNTKPVTPSLRVLRATTINPKSPSPINLIDTGKKRRRVRVESDSEQERNENTDMEVDSNTNPQYE